VRMAVLRSGEWQAFVHYGQAVGNHAQEEALTYELHEGTQVITADSGTVAYGSPYHRNYFSRGAANNVPLVDGQGQQRWNPGSVLAFDTADNRLVVDHPNYRNDVSVQRSFHLAADGFDEVTKLKVLSGNSQRRLGAAFHTPCAVDGLKGLQEAAGGATPPPNVSTAYWKNPAAYSAAGAWSARLSCGGRDYTLSVSAGGPQRVFLAKAPDVPLPKERNVLYYEVVGREVAFEFKLEPAR
jgi:oligo-alginate lyase